MRNKQTGPAAPADVLADVVSRVTYKPGWTFTLTDIDRGQGCEGLTLLIGANVPDSWGSANIDILHLMPVPAAAYDAETWARWVLEQVFLVERHEAMEFLKLDGVAPFFPEHGPGRDPYAVAAVKSREQAHAAAVPWLGLPVSDPHFREG